MQSRRLTRRGWTALGLLVLGGLGLAGLRMAIARRGVALLDTGDRALAGGDGAIRLAAEGRFGADPAQVVQLFVPTDRAHDPMVTGIALPVVMFIHGGGWSDGNPFDYRFIARMLAPHGYAVVLAGYRLGAQGRYPAMIDDGDAALRWIADHAPAAGGAPQRTALIGHSAGAYNAIMLALDPRRADDNDVRVTGAIGLAGPYDFLPLDDPMTIDAFGDHPDLAETQPIHHVRSHAPPMLLIHGSDDTRVYPRHTISLGRALARAGAHGETHLLPGISHEGLIMRFARPFIRDRRVAALVLDFLARVTAGDARPVASAAVQADLR